MQDMHTALIPVISSECRGGKSHLTAPLYAGNECAESNGGCDQICIDTFQSYECSCRAGYSLSNDGYTCIGKFY